MDYKRIEPVGVYEEFGNFNYGATGRALGFPREVLLRARGSSRFSRASALAAHGPGTPSGNPPYGDFPEDKSPDPSRHGVLRPQLLGRGLDLDEGVVAQEVVGAVEQCCMGLVGSSPTEMFPGLARPTGSSSSCSLGLAEVEPQDGATSTSRSLGQQTPSTRAAT